MKPSPYSIIFSIFLFLFPSVFGDKDFVSLAPGKTENVSQLAETLNSTMNDNNQMVDNFTVPETRNNARIPRLQAYQGFESVDHQGCSCKEELRAIREQWKYERSQRMVMKGTLELFATDLINLKTQINSRKTNSTRGQQFQPMSGSTEVAFSARVSDHLTDLQPHQIIVFDQLITNVASAYNPSTGIFTAPLSGTYQLFATVLSGFNSKVESALIINDIEVARLYSGAQHAHGSSSAAVILLLEKGDEATVRVLYQPTSHVHGVYTTFSGYLLRPI